MIKFKKVISSFLAVGLISGCLQSITFAGTVAAVWKETIGSGASAVTQTVHEAYDSESGTFGDGGRTIIHTTDANTSNTYFFGVELPEKITSGRIVADAEFTGVSTTANEMIELFSLSNESSGWKGTVLSGLVFGGSNSLRAKNSTYAGRKLFSSSLIAYSEPEKVKFVAERTDDASEWSINIYRETTGEAVRIFTYTVPKSTLPDIKYILNSSWNGKSKTAQLTVNKFKVTAFAADYGKDFSAEYVPSVDDGSDRTVDINVSGTAAADIKEVDAYIVNEDTDAKTLLDSSNVSYKDGAVQITVPTAYYGILSIDLALKTEGGVFLLNVPLTGDPFEKQYITGLSLDEISEGTSGGTLAVAPDFSSIVLKFSNFIDADTLGAVTFTGNGVTNFKKELSDDEKTLAISFDPLTDKELYTLNIGTALKSQNNFYISEEITYKYFVDSDLKKLNITNYNTGEKYVLLPGGKKIDLEFNFDVKPETLYSGIEFTKADGTPIEGGYTVTAADSADKATVKFGRLRRGEYKLITTSTLKADEQGVETREAVWSFVVEKDDDEPEIYGNFSDFGNGKLTASDLTAGNTSFASSTYEIMTSEEEGIKYLATTGNGSVKGGGITVTLPKAVVKGKIAFDFYFKAIGGSIKRNLFSVKDSSNKKVCMFQVNQDNVISKNSESATINGEFTDNEYVKDDDGFLNLRVVFMAEDESSDWDIRVYDKFRSLTEPTWKGKAGRVYDSANKKYGLYSIAQMTFFDIWWQNGNDENGAGVAVVEYAYHILPVPEVMTSNIETAQPDTDEFNLYLDSDLNESDLSEDGAVTLTDGEREIPAVTEYSAGERRLKIIPKEYLDYDTSYEIKFGKMICENVSFKTPKCPVLLNKAPVMSGTGTARSVLISAENNTASEAKIYAFAKIFDSEGRLIKTVGDDSFVLEANQSLNNAVLPLNGVTLQEGFKVKTFIWAEQGGLIYPITSPYELTD